MCILQPFCGIGKGVLLPLTIFIGCEDILVENCVECGTFRESRPDYIQNVTYRNCIVLETPTLYDNKEGDEGWRGGCAAINHVLAYTRNLAVGWTDV